jgi:hypothetical protein
MREASQLTSRLIMSRFRVKMKYNVLLMIVMVS